MEKDSGGSATGSSDQVQFLTLPAGKP